MDELRSSENIGIFKTHIRQMKSLRLDRIIKDQLGLSFQQIVILRIISERTDCNLNELAYYLGISNPAASAAVQKLVEAGFITRQEYQNDRRIKFLLLSEIGRKKLDEFRNFSSVLGEVFLNTLTLEEQNTFLGYFEKGILAIIEYIHEEAK